jgi:cell fate regulator YaaT (PSP1 superfamily)
MTKIVGIRFQRAGKIYYFDPLDYELETANHVIVETARGVEMGTVLIPPKEVEDDKVVQPLKPVIRIATDEDEKIVERNKEREVEAFAICKEKIARHGLEMKLIAAEYTFDSNKLLFYFTADGRIDFRELVKDLASVFRTRIELRQIGVRDETKMIGGIGICGRELCCKAYLSDFVPVSIKMAKEQNLSLNPTKISGVCGRLMCCLKNEQETYEYLNARMPSVNDTVTTPSGMVGKVTAVNILRQTVRIVVDTGEEREQQEYRVDELKFIPRRRRDVKVTDEELKELEGLEDQAEGAEEKQQKSARRERRSRRDGENPAGVRGKKSERENAEQAEQTDHSDRREQGEQNERAERGEWNEQGERGNRRNGRNRRHNNRNSGKKQEHHTNGTDGNTPTQP